MERGGAVYIITNKLNKVLYTGVTSDLKTRVFEHKEKVHPTSFSAKYNLNKLVYYKGFNNIEEAIAEEKRIKGGSRKKKIILIESINSKWEDLTTTLFNHVIASRTQWSEAISYYNHKIASSFVPHSSQ